MKWYVPSLITSAMVAMVVFFGCKPADRDARGYLDAQCFPDNTCNAGLSCQSSVCVRGAGSSSGGASGSGGTNASGGQSTSNDTGGSGSGGDTSSGGNQGNGGSTDSGGSPGNGGSNGGSSGSGGTSSTGTNACSATSASNAVAFCNGLALGAMTGYGWVALGAGDFITDPTCDTGKAAITKAASCLTTTNWNKANVLCMTGKVPALPPTPLAADYASNWGVQIGVNAKDPNAGMGGSAWKNITFSLDGSPLTSLRAVIHKSGDAAETSYCAAMTPGTALPITKFNSTCWDETGGKFLTESDGPSIDQVGVQVSSTATEIPVANLCLTKIEFGN